jgi:sugar lactone lactonase YvrE
VHGKVYVLNFGASKLQRTAAGFDASTAVEDVATFPSIGAPAPRNVSNPDGSTDTIMFGSNGFPAPNGMTFSRSGSLYVSDSFQGAIFRIDNVATCTMPCPVSLVAHDPLLATAGFPPFGANGIALDADETALFIANTGDSRILKMDLASRSISVLAESVHGADGVALDANGRVVARLGEFQGIRRDGAPIDSSVAATVGHVNCTFSSRLRRTLRSRRDSLMNEYVSGDTASFNCSRGSRGGRGRPKRSATRSKYSPIVSCESSTAW